MHKHLNDNPTPRYPLFAAGAARVNDLAKHGGVGGRTTLWAAISEGRLRAVRHGRCTIVLERDWTAFLDSMPSTHTMTENQEAA